MTNRDLALRLSARLTDRIAYTAGVGLDRARLFLVQQIKDPLSTPARTVQSRLGVKRAVTPATVGRPPRLVSGKLRDSVTSVALPNPPTGLDDLVVSVGTTAKSKDRFDYGKFLELIQPGKAGSGQHKFIEPTLRRCLTKLGDLVGREVKVGG